jgi:hypothetical protein
VFIVRFVNVAIADSVLSRADDLSGALVVLRESPR